MYCYICERALEEHGGSQFKGCIHCVCRKCITKEIKQASRKGLECAAFNGFYKCEGFIARKDLEFMVSERAYAIYLERTASDNDTKKKRTSGSVKFAELNLSMEEKESGWAHKASFIDEQVRRWKMSQEEAFEYLENITLLENRAIISCPICLDDDVPPAAGIVLKDCLHMFCKPCLTSHIRKCDKAEVTCPFVKDDFRCAEPLKAREVAALVDQEEVLRHFENLSLKEAAASMRGAFQCLTPDCLGFCDAGGMTQGFFVCPKCQARNCVACKVIHDGTCEQYRTQLEDRKNRDQNIINDRLSAEEIQRRLANRIMVPCPNCKYGIEKNGGCPHMRCSKCGHNFNWTGRPS